MTYHEDEVIIRIGRVGRRDLRAWCRAGWVRPDDAGGGPIYDDADLARIRLIRDLQKDMALPRDAVALILSLLDQVHGLRHELRALAEAIGEEPEAERRRMRAAYLRRREGR